MTNTKAFYKSKTLWFNVLSVVTLIASYFGFGDFTLDEETKNTVMTILGGVIAAGNAGLRFTTKQAVGTEDK